MYKIKAFNKMYTYISADIEIKIRPCIYTEIHFKESVHTIIETGKSSLCRVDQQAGNSFRS